MKNEELILQILGELKAGQEKLETEVRRTRMLVEQQDHKISLIAEQYTDIAEKLDKANDRADRRHARQAAHAGNRCDEPHSRTQRSSQS